MTRPFRISTRLRSFRYAFRGISLLLQSQHNAWIHLAVTAAACGLGFALGLTRSEWCWIVLAAGAVWTAEAMNTAFEHLADAVSPAHHPLVGNAKDAAAGAVLIAAAAAVVIGLLVFGIHLVALVSPE
jgi:diacylglycerol kinase (ATP)